MKNGSPAGRVGLVTFVAFAARMLVGLWAGPRFPPTADGVYYDTLARRLAAGQGYTWAWPDGVVTPVAHYPVGYPAMLAVAYRVLGPSPHSVTLVNAFLGAVGAGAVAWVLARGSARRALAGGLVVALHPALLLYTPAVMTEGASAALLALTMAFGEGAATAISPRRKGAWLALAALTVGLATLVRPQNLVMAPLVGALAMGAMEGNGGRPNWARRVGGALAASALALATCLPWSARNCAVMDGCAFVSANGGWNLLIGAQTEGGAWEPVQVPEPCREVWPEVAKDRCFAAAARRTILGNVGAYVARVPAKLGVTFDYFGAGPWYLHSANGAAFSQDAKVASGAFETLVSRVLLLGALAWAGLSVGPRRRVRWALALGGAFFACVATAWPAYLLLAGALVALGPSRLTDGSPLAPWTLGIVAATALVHGLFFGAGRYGLVVVPFVTGLTFVGKAGPFSLRGAVGGERLPPSTPDRGSLAQAVRPGREESPSSTECDAG